MARPSTYDFDLAKEVCLLVQDGLNIKAALAIDDRFPHFSTWCKWKRENTELYDLYINAIQDKADDVDYRIDKTIEDLKNNKIDPSVANVIIQTYKWKAAKYYPKMFGEKQQIDHTTKGEPIQQKQINITIDGKEIDLGT